VSEVPLYIAEQRSKPYAHSSAFDWQKQATRLKCMYTDSHRRRIMHLNTDELTDESHLHETGSLFGWIEPEIAQHPKST
jgi:hypothetical protein